MIELESGAGLLFLISAENVSESSESIDVCI